MSDQITYDNKVDLQVATNIANINKVTASDMNEIKNVVNSHADDINTHAEEINELDAPEKWVSVGTTAPTDGRRVWFEKGKNLFDGQLELGMYDETGAKATNNANYRNVAPINVQPSTTYTFSINGTSQKYVIYLYKKDGTFIRVNTLTSGTFTTPAEAYLLNFRCFNADFTSDYANLKIQLEKGSNATSYEPYIEQSIKVDNEDFVSMSDLVSVGANQPSDGKRVWFCKSNNLFNNNAERKNAYVVNPGSTGQVVSYSYSSATYSFVNCCEVKQGKTYTISWKQSQTPASTNGRQGCIVDNDNIVHQYIMVTWHNGENYDTFTANANGFLILGTDIFATNIQIYESDIEEGIYVDNEQWLFNNYSTSEQVIGRWIDGKPIYRKVVNLGALPNATSKQVAHNISNMGSVVTLRGMVTDYRFFPLPFVATSNAYAISIFADTTNINVMTGNDRSNLTGFVIIEYTKTTD